MLPGQIRPALLLLVLVTQQLFVLRCQKVQDLLETRPLLGKLVRLVEGLREEVLLCLQIRLRVGDHLLGILNEIFKTRDDLSDLTYHAGGVGHVHAKLVGFLTVDDALVFGTVLDHAQVESRKLTNRHVGVAFCLAHDLGKERGARLLLVGKGPLAYGHGEPALGVGVHTGGHVLADALDAALRLCDGTLIVGKLGSGEHDAGVVRLLQVFQLLDGIGQLGLLLNERIAGGQGLDFSRRERDLTGVLCRPSHVLAVHDLIDKVLLAIKNVPKTGVKAPLGHVHVFGNELVDILLTERTTVSLLYVAGSPRRIQMVNGHHTLLRVHANAHLARRADQHANLAVIDVLKELLAPCITVRLVNKCDLPLGDPALDQNIAQIVVEPRTLRIEIPVGRVGILRIGAALVGALRGRHVQENDLRALAVGALLVFREDVLGRAVDLAVRLVGERRVDHALGVGYLAPVAGDLEHVVHLGVNALDLLGSLLEVLHVLPLELARLAFYDLNRPALHLGDFEVGKLGYNVGETAEEELKLAQVAEIGEHLLLPHTGSAGVDFPFVDHLAELLRPGIKGFESQLVQHVGLEVALHDVQLYHGVHDRGSGGEYDTATAVETLQVAGFGIEIKGSLRPLGTAQTGYVGHLGDVFEVFEVVRLVHKEGVNAQHLEIDVALVLGLGRQLLQPLLQLCLFLLHLLDGQPLAVPALGSLLCNGLDDLVDLLPVEAGLVVGRHGDLLELLVGQNDCVVVTVCDLVGEDPAVRGGKALLVGYQQAGCGEVLLKFHAPLRHNRLGYHEHGLFDDTKLPHLHSGRRHFQGLARADSVSQQGVTARGNDAVYGVRLVGHQRVGRIDAVDGQVRAVVSGIDEGVEYLVVHPSEGVSAPLVLPNPVLKLLLDGLYLLVCRLGLRLVEDRDLLAVSVLEGIHDLDGSASHHGVDQIQEGFACRSPRLVVVVAALKPLIVHDNLEFAA